MFGQLLHGFCYVTFTKDIRISPMDQAVWL